MTPDPGTPLSAAEPRWPSMLALLIAWVRPALTTRRTRHLRLIDAWIAHLVAVLATLFSLAVVEGISYRSYRESIKESVMVSIGGMVHDFQRYPVGALMSLIGLAAVIEGSLVLLATLLMPWGARDEPAADSFRHALRRTWLNCGHVPVLILVAGIAIGEIDAYAYRWHRVEWQPVEHMIPNQPLKDATQEELEEYDRQIEELRSIVDNSRPFLVEFDDEAMTYIVILAGIWFLWALLRGLGADRPVRTPEHPPMCRACGYNLTGLPPDGRCPECGRPVAESIGPDASPGPAWERPADPSGGYLRTLYAWMSSPQTQANDLRLTPARRRHPTFLLINVILCGLAAGIGIALIFWWDETSRGRDFDREILTLGAPITGSIWSAFVLLFAAGAAFVPGMVMLARDRRNLLSGTFQAACYCSGWLLAWTAVGVATFAITVLKFDDLIRPIAQSINVRPHLFAPLINLTVHAACGLLFVVTVYRASAGVRYACR